MALPECHPLYPWQANNAESRRYSNRAQREMQEEWVEVIKTGQRVDCGKGDKEGKQKRKEEKMK